MSKSAVLLALIYISLGMDVPSINFGSFIIKIPFATVGILALLALIYARSVKLPVFIISFSMVLMYFSSVIFSFNLRGLFSVFILICCTVSAWWASRTAKISEKIISESASIVLWVVSAVCLMQSVFTSRASFFLYEPSYLAIFLLPILFILFKENIGFMRFSALALILVTSQSFLYFIFLFLFFAFKFVRFSFFSAIYVSVIFLFFSFFVSSIPRINSALSLFYSIGGLNSDSLIRILVVVGGNRLERSLEALVVFKDNVWFGAGVGETGSAFLNELYSQRIVLSHTAPDYSPGGVSNNMFLQLLSEVGLLGGSIIIGLVSYVLAIIFYKGGPIGRAFSASAMVTLLMEGTLFRIYFILSLAFVYFNINGGEPKRYG